MLQLCDGMAAHGFESMLVTPSDSDTNLDDGADNSNVVPMELPSLSSRNPLQLFVFLRAVLSLRKLIRQRNVDVVHANEILDIYAPVAAKLCGRKVCWNVRAELSAWPMVNWLLPRIARLLADRIVVASQSVIHHMFSDVPSEKIEVIYDPGFDLNKFQAIKSGDEVRESLGVKRDAPLVLLVSKMSRRKGHVTFIKSLPTVLARHPDVQFILVGGELGGRHLGYLDELLSLIHI